MWGKWFRNPFCNEKIEFVPVLGSGGKQEGEFVCFLDCDGVLSDFIGGLCKRFKIDREGVFSLSRGRPLPWDLEKLVGLDQKSIWRSLDADFWAGLDLYPWADRLVGELKKIFGNGLVICSSPGFLTGDGSVGTLVAGREKWIMRNFPGFWDSFVFVFRKDVLASDRCVLIDDSEENCEKFMSRGGWSLLFPQEWNRNWHFLRYEDVVEYVVFGIRRFMDWKGIKCS